MRFKGKSPTRSWSQLPPDVVRLIVTQLLLDVSSTAFLPQIWQQREHWLSRMIYAVVRDTEVVEQVMMVCPAWMNALEYHLYWQHATSIFDPTDFHFPESRQSRASPYRHFRYNLFTRCCIPCRINHPDSAVHAQACKRQVYTYALDHVPTCKEHRKDTFCGICLRDCSDEENAVVENEDFECWPQIEATCRFCRIEWLIRYAKDGEQSGVKELEAIGGKQLTPQDWEARQAVDAYVEMGEGTIREVIVLCLEKLWLRKHTKIAEMMNLAVATSRLQNRTSGRSGYRRMSVGVDQYESEEEMSEVDDEDDPELMSLTEDRGGVRELAINDWARNRILEGHWLSPADQWYSLQGQARPEWSHPPHIPAHHPCPWSASDNEDVQHPPELIAQSAPPPSLPLCSLAFEAYRRQMRSVLLPAMMNIVRRIVMECSMDGTDACIRVAKMDVEEVARALRVSGVWYNGTDWVRDRDDSSVSSKSSSEATSPVLSTSTLQTTPSPPPGSEHKKDEPTSSIPPQHIVPSQGTTSSQFKRALPIAISPVLESPMQIPSIPYIPESVEKFPHFTVDTFKSIWRDACAPLFQCKCTICERAEYHMNLEAGTVVPSQDYEMDRRLPDDRDQNFLDRPIQVEIMPATEEDEEEYMLSPNVSDIADAYSDDETRENELPMRRKRSADDLEYEDYVEDAELDPGEMFRQSKFATPPSTPPKRPRLDVDGSAEPVRAAPPVKQPLLVEAVRLEKRGSEELNDDGSAQDSDLTVRGVYPETPAGSMRKRAKTDSFSGISHRPLSSLTASGLDGTSEDWEPVPRRIIDITDEELKMIDLAIEKKLQEIDRMASRC